MLGRRLFSNCVCCRQRMKSFPDYIRLPDLPLKAHLPDYVWSANDDKAKLVQQPLSVSIQVDADLAKAGKSDDISDSISYSQLTKIAQALVTDDAVFAGGIRQVASEIADGVGAYAEPILGHFNTNVRVKQSKAVFKADAVGVQITRSSLSRLDKLVFTFHRYRLDSLIGVNDFEREQRQPLHLDASLHLEEGASSEWNPSQWAALFERHAAECQPLTLETFLERLSETAFRQCAPLQKIDFSIHKPFATKWAGPPNVAISRTRENPPMDLSASATEFSSIPLLKYKGTLLMGIINLTPDSFGTAPSTFEGSLEEARRQVDAGVHILDLGGVSTRPGAADVSEEEELRRVIPFVKAIRETTWGKSVVLSIDTFRANVARQALTNGADWINDVKAGTHDPDFAMWKVIKEFGCPIVLMHSRGDAQTMNGMASYQGDVVDIIRTELLGRINEAIAHGVKPELIIVDPGIGFAKNAATNWLLLARLKEWHSGDLARFPMLVGTSRKRFLGALLDQSDPSQRDVATAATMVEAIRAGAKIVRVHNPRLVRDAVQTADAMYEQTRV